MGKQFRLRISRVIPAFHSCRSKDDAAPPAADAPVGSYRVPVVSPGCGYVDPPPNLTAEDPNAATAAAGDLPAERDASTYLWQKEEKWHVLQPTPARLKIDSEYGGQELFPPLPLRRRPRRPAATAKKKKIKSRPKAPAGRLSTSSADTHWFSSEEEEFIEDYDYDETETLVSSSRSFSTDFSSPDYAPRLKPIRESPDRRRQPRRKGGGANPSPGSPPSVVGGGRRPSVSSALRRFLMTPPCGAAAEGKVAESFAVVKKSEDPYRDFRRSMMEMVVEKRIYEEGELEQLLRCFLSLNSRHHHSAIVRAFSDVCADLFPLSRSCTSAAATPPPATSS